VVVVVGQSTVVDAVVVVVVGGGAMGWHATATKTATQVTSVHVRTALARTQPTPIGPMALARRARIRTPCRLRTTVAR
jgi:hypothetical protein